MNRVFSVERRQRASVLVISLYLHLIARIENKFSVHHFSSSPLSVMCSTCCTEKRGGKLTIASHAIFFNDFPLPSSHALAPLQVTGKKCDNAESHVGYYDVLIDCLTTSVLRKKFLKKKKRVVKIGRRKTSDVPSRFLFHLSQPNDVAKRYKRIQWCMLTLIGFFATSLLHRLNKMFITPLNVNSSSTLVSQKNRQQNKASLLLSFSKMTENFPRP